MFPVTKSVTQYDKSAMMDRSPRPADNAGDVTENITECLEYVYVDDPKDGNESSAEDESEKPNKECNNVKRISQSAGPAVSYMREQIKKLNDAEIHKNARNTVNGKYSDDDSILFVPLEDDDDSAPVADLEFFKNAGKYCIKIQSMILEILS